MNVLEEDTKILVDFVDSLDLGGYSRWKEFQQALRLLPSKNDHWETIENILKDITKEY